MGTNPSRYLPGPKNIIPLHPGAGIAIMGDAWVSGWYAVATDLMILKKAYSSEKHHLVLRRFEGF